MELLKFPCLQYVENNKQSGSDWFRLESNKEGTKWFGKCWYMHNLLKYEFDVEFDIPVTYPTTAPEIALPELDGKTAKMYRGGKICLTDHFKPLWARNVPKFGIAHAMALGVSTLNIPPPSLDLLHLSFLTARSLAGRGDSGSHREGNHYVQGKVANSTR